MARPKRTPKDGNQGQIVKELRAAGCVVIDVADLPGDSKENPLDLFVLSPDRRTWVQVEIKVGLMADFKDHQIEYMRRLDVWPPEWRVNDVPVIVAYKAGDVLGFFKEV
jgi:hypothetical protein